MMLAIPDGENGLVAGFIKMANLLVSRHVFIFDCDPVWEGEPPGEPRYDVCDY